MHGDALRGLPDVGLHVAGLERRGRARLMHHRPHPGVGGRVDGLELLDEGRRDRGLAGVDHLRGDARDGAGLVALARLERLVAELEGNLEGAVGLLDVEAGLGELAHRDVVGRRSPRQEGERLLGGARRLGVLVAPAVRLGLDQAERAERLARRAAGDAALGARRRRRRGRCASSACAAAAR